MVTRPWTEDDGRAAEATLLDEMAANLERRQTVLREVIVAIEEEIADLKRRVDLAKQNPRSPQRQRLLDFLGRELARAGLRKQDVQRDLADLNRKRAEARQEAQELRSGIPQVPAAPGINKTFRMAARQILAPEVYKSVLQKAVEIRAARGGGPSLP